MSQVTIAEYSKRRLIALGYGPIAFLIVGYFAFSKIPMNEVLDAGRWWSRPNAIVESAAVIIYLGFVAYQSITILGMGKRFLWLDGRQLMTGFRKLGDLASLDVQNGQIEKRYLHDVISIPGAGGKRIVIRTGLARESGSTLLAQLKEAQCKLQ